jgi:hypothetical protein
MAVTVRKRAIVDSANIREGVLLTGAYNGRNRVFFLPEAAVHEPPTSIIKLYHGGRRLQPIEYAAIESFPGSGYDRVCIIFAPQTTSQIYADYNVAE